MDYKGPTEDDLANIQALNHCFIVAISGTGTDGFGELAERRLTGSERDHLAAAPFLLFSFREQDDDYWQHVLAHDRQCDLIDSAAPPNESIRHVQVAGLAFLWQLSRRNPYVSRVVSGAPVSWCERLAGLTLTSLLDRAARRSDLLCARFAGKRYLWHRLLEGGIDSKHSLRRTSHHCALQALLTGENPIHKGTVAAAACSMQDPRRRRAFRGTVGVRETKV